MNGDKRIKTVLYAIIFFVFTSAIFAEGDYVSALDTAEKLNTFLSWDPLSEDFYFSKSGHRAQCRVGLPMMLLSGKELVFIAPPKIINSVLSISKETAIRLESFFGYSLEQPIYRIGAILIDPGHGGKDPGTHGSYTENGKTIVVKEKDITLKTSKELYELLKVRYPDKKILMTRYDDSFPTLDERVEMANSVKLNKYEAILYISVHANYSWNSKASGFEVWYLPPEYRREVISKDAVSKEIFPIVNSMLEEEFTMESIMIAQSILDGLDASIGKQSKKRGIMEQAWFVVRNAKMPSVLIELGFVSNPTEVRLLNTPSYLKKCAEGIYNGLVSFITHFEGSGGFTGEGRKKL
ncbi:N-acetylmuramoyl-L-alanine amidase [Treponema phagedenis]|nr:N-acetylmuramoyl-L-alanine amidase [Treponema phagedenis]QEJ96432.1 N-acetylmuramoyl-L-alanine amidase [Treponema phagedenis]QEJ99666.1 N-acetylmuramoyl-L-alanine amidase [Treponema phagedenis]QEK02289.1 N-acetylmuramoyl-L-alanine amidase [Treponema phagedenis]QEK05217.1 N-acetylmuramoyl-L-alanine amidase [Treponema phagedenis]